MTRRVYVAVAHFDPRGAVAPHVLRNVEALGDIANRLVVVSTASLDTAAEAAIRQRAELIRRENAGYDFYSYKVALDAAEGIDGYDAVVVCNDSFVGPLVPFSQIFDAMRTRRADFWGITQTRRRAPHVQSYFVVFNRSAVRSRPFRHFWRHLEPLSDRAQVIARYEVGMSQRLARNGLGFASYFEETSADRRLARARYEWAVIQNVRRLPPRRRLKALRTQAREHWNPSAALADRALDDGRLPVVKIDTLRYDPYTLGSLRLLAALERRWPEVFAGVRDFIDATTRYYPPRPYESTGPTDPPWGLRHLIGYGP